MLFELDTPTTQWLLQLKVLSPRETVQGSHAYQIDETAAKAFENGTRIAPILQHIYRSRDLPPPQYLSHLKVSGQTAAQLYNWNYLNEVLSTPDIGPQKTKLRNRPLNQKLHHQRGPTPPRPGPPSTQTTRSQQPRS